MKENNKKSVLDMVEEYMDANFPMVEYHINRSDDTWPNFTLPMPMFKDKKADYYGLFIEVKEPDVVLYRKTLRKEKWVNDKIERQAEVLSFMKFNGYCATFAIGFGNFQKVIDRYMEPYVKQMEEAAAKLEAKEQDDGDNNAKTAK